MRQKVTQLYYYYYRHSALGRFGQRPELSQVAGMALVRCILGKFLGVVCHCFPPTQLYNNKIHVYFLHENSMRKINLNILFSQHKLKLRLNELHGPRIQCQSSTSTCGKQLLLRTTESKTRTFEPNSVAQRSKV